MKEPTDFEEVAPGLRRFGLNSDYAVEVLASERERTVSLRVVSDWEIKRESSTLPSSPRT